MDDEETGFSYYDFRTTIDNHQIRPGYLPAAIALTSTQLQSLRAELSGMGHDITFDPENNNQFILDGIRIEEVPPEPIPTVAEEITNFVRRVENTTEEIAWHPTNVIIADPMPEATPYKNIDSELRNFIFWLHQNITQEKRIEADRRFNEMRDRIWPEGSLTEST